MAQNDMDTDGADETTDDSQKTTEDDLRNLKYGNGEVETDGKTTEDDTTETDDSDDTSEDGGEADGKTEDQTDDDETSEDDSSQFVKELPNIKGDTVVDYARNLESTIIESNKEGKRLSDENTALKAQLTKDSGDSQDDNTDGASDDQVSAPTPLELYAKQQMDKDIATAFSAFQKDYPQAVPGTPEYDMFTNEVAIFSKTIMDSQGRIPDFAELYNKAAISLGWEKGSSPTGKEKLDMAVKDQTAVTKTTSATKTAPKSKVTPAMIALNKKIYPEKSEEQIRKELEPHIK